LSGEQAGALGRDAAQRAAQEAGKNRAWSEGWVWQQEPSGQGNEHGSATGVRLLSDQPARTCQSAAQQYLQAGPSPLLCPNSILPQHRVSGCLGPHLSAGWGGGGGGGGGPHPGGVGGGGAGPPPPPPPALLAHPPAGHPCDERPRDEGSATQDGGHHTWGRCGVGAVPGHSTALQHLPGASRLPMPCISRHS
jgi:hypothetical protein